VENGGHVFGELEGRGGEFLEEILERNELSGSETVRVAFEAANRVLGSNDFISGLEEDFVGIVERAGGLVESEIAVEHPATHRTNEKEWIVYENLQLVHDRVLASQKFLWVERVRTWRNRVGTCKGKERGFEENHNANLKWKKSHHGIWKNSLKKELCCANGEGMDFSLNFCSLKLWVNNLDEGTDQKTKITKWKERAKRFLSMKVDGKLHDDPQPSARTHNPTTKPNQRKSNG
jgi:hypothetical protein